MHLHYVNNDLLNSNVNYICHQVNCQKVMGAGLAKQIAERWPHVKEEYMKTEPKLGTIGLVLVGERQAVVNMYSQYGYGTDKKYTDYEAFYKCLQEIHDVTKDTSIIGFPYGIGCGLGGGDWDIIEKMIEKVLFDREVYIFKKDGEAIKENNSYENCNKLYKAKNYCCYSQTDMGRQINKFVQENPQAEIVSLSSNHDEVQWYLTIFYKE